MTMVSYAVYDVDTGEVVHVHVEPDGLDTAPEEIVQLADARRARRLGVIRMPKEGFPAQPVRVVAGALRAADKDAGFGAAGGTSRIFEPVAERRYELRGPGKDTNPDDS
ncbi:hypothetical protein [Corallococcus sp. CA054B]|uniref:hypothetical protein n=1 Tax=Corallococcus sp. CA054B TaxID=2316734 RepID=UPI0011C36BF2|nr:hypothetical protein [Corallococcus sp. CA054B]